MKVWVDDERPVPDDSWTLAKTYPEAIKYLEENHVTHLSLDHDLGCIDQKTGREMTGYDVLMRVVMSKLAGNFVPEVDVHSANVPAGDRMRGVIERYLKE